MLSTITGGISHGALARMNRYRQTMLSLLAREQSPRLLVRFAHRFYLESSPPTTLPQQLRCERGTLARHQTWQRRH